MTEVTAVEIPAELDAHEAAGLLDKLVAEPEPKKVVEKDPVTGKFVKAKSDEETPGEVEEVEEEVELDAEGKPVVKEDVEETDDEEEKPVVRALKVKLDGMEQDVPEDEVVKGYLRQADYTRKTQELAEARKRFEAEELPAVRKEREYYAQSLERLTEALEALAPTQEPDWEAIAKAETPEVFSQKFAAWKKGQEQKAKVDAEHARVLALHEQEETRMRAVRLQQETERLEVAIPELKDPEKGKVLREDLIAYAKSVGFSDDDLANVEDHRAFIILNKARLHDESQKRRPAVQAKVEKAIQGLKPVGSVPAKPKAKVTELLRGKLKASGSQEDAAALIDSLVGGKAP